MKRIVCILSAAAFLLNVHAVAEEFFPLVKDHEAQSCFLLDRDAPKEIPEAIGHFNQALKTITGTALPTMRDKDVPGNRIIFAIRKAESLMTGDNFAITFPDARTLRIECDASAVQWALSHIIRKFANAEWILQEECGLSYTPMADLAIPREPVEVKNISWPISRTYNIKNCHWRQNYQRRLIIEHALTYYAFPAKKYAKDKSWPQAVMPVLKGEKITEPPNPKVLPSYWQPCYSNPETAKIAVQNILEYLQEHPETEGISLGANDNGGFCECPECLKLDNGGENGRSESYFTFINRVLEEVCREYPKLLVSAFAYVETYLPPSFKLHPNAVVYLTIDINSCVDPELREKHRKVIAEWGSKADLLGLWDYSWGYPYPAPRVFLPVHMEMLKHLFENNAKAYYGECWVHDALEGPKQYLIAKMLWDSNQDMEKLENEWYVRCVGEKAAPFLKAYYKVWTDYFSGAAMQTPWFKSAVNVYMTYPDISCVYGLKESDFQAADEAMKQVVALAETEQEKQRAALMMRHWRYTEARLRLLGAGIYDPKATIGSTEQALALLDTVLKAPAYVSRYEQISDLLLQDRNLHDCYLYPWYTKNGGSPIGRDFSEPVGNHILAAYKFIDQPEVAEKMRQIADAADQPALTRQLCRALSDPSKLHNLLTEGNAESGVPANYGLHPNTEGNAELSTSSEYKAEGEKSFQVTINGSDAWFLFPIKAQPLRTYLAMFKVYIPKPSAEGYMERNIYSYIDDLPRQFRLSPSLKLFGGVWQTFSVLTTTLPEANCVKLQIRFKNFDPGDKIYIDDIQIMEIGAAPAAHET